ncbi:hypothetical protein SISNIDRAFT_50775 [Sistotremastrum niveocremeum HHB9708]|uniref:Tetratricopeptide SHNi-TPR domain-containing protein n=1 Tax=Sistotremastrum niveocremeum HHB9708 TaxID=1314777 RepID=A0A164VZM0_9AGAM|nr:hypothetical protein SISNIDRAFT_50775 [Sistotremastrum niveocremeum HHB9708]
MSPEDDKQAVEDLANGTSTSTLEEYIELGKRAFILRQFEEAVDQYAKALELLQEKHGENSAESADTWLQYGKALLENAISQNAVLGKADDQESEEPDSLKDKKRFFFGADGEGAEGEDDAGVQLSALPDDGEDEPEDENDGDREDANSEPEDDFAVAWEALETAKLIYSRQQDEGDEIKLKLADTYIALGDVSLETENFDQAILDFTAGTKLKMDILPFSSRQIAEAHYKLGLVLDLTSGRLADAIEHMETAIASVDARLTELRNGQQGVFDQAAEPPKDSKGKGKAKRLVRDPLVRDMSSEQIASEIKDLEEMKQELELKVDEIKTAPHDKTAGTVPELVAKTLDAELNVSGRSNVEGATVNDLTSMVKKKAKTAAPSADLKRKAEDDVESANGSSDKRAKVSEEP